MNPSVEIALINTNGKFSELETAWNRLLEESDNCSVFLTWEWVRNWWQAFGAGRTLHIVAGRDEQGGLIGLAPFMLTSRQMFGFTVKSLEFIGAGPEATPDYMNFIIRKGWEGPFIRSVFRHLRETSGAWDRVYLRDMKEDAGVFGCLDENVRGTFPHYEAANGGCVYTRLPGTWEEYLQALSRKSRYNIGKKERDMAKRYRLGFTCCDSPDQVDPVMRKLCELHQKRMQVKGMTGGSLQDRFWEFHRNVARDFQARGWLFVGMMTADEQVVACQYAYQYRGKAFHYQSGIDPEFARWSVGLISNAWMIRESIQRGLREYDFLRGGEDYKYHWAKESRRNMEIAVWSRSARGLFFSALYNGRSVLKNVKKRFEGVSGPRRHDGERHERPAPGDEGPREWAQGQAQGSLYKGA